MATRAEDPAVHVVRRRASLLAFAAVAIGGRAFADGQPKPTGETALMLTEPRLEQRAEQPYVGIRSSVTLPEIGTVRFHRR